MGMTIHYGLQLSENDPALARKRVEELRQRALTLPFEDVGKIQHLKGDACHGKRDSMHWFASLDTTNNWPLVIPEEIIAFAAKPGMGCETAWFGLRKAGGKYGWEAFCKTCGAVGDALNFLRCHGSVIAMLDHAQELGILRTVKDEGHYWEHRDWQETVDLNGRWKLMARDDQAIEDRLAKWFGPVKAVKGKEQFVYAEEALVNEEVAQ